MIYSGNSRANTDRSSAPVACSTDGTWENEDVAATGSGRDHDPWQWPAT